MEKESRRKKVKRFLKRKKKSIVVISMVLLTVLTLLGLAYATLTGTLNITGTGNIRNSKWQVKFDNLSQVALNGTAEEAAAPHIDTNNYTRIVDYSIVLNQPGDYATYTFDVVNEGDYDAKIGDIVVSSPSCHGVGDDALTDAANVCDNLTYTVTYADGSALALNQVLQSKDTAHMKFKLMYNDDTPAAELPKDDVEVTNLSIKITYVQADKARVNDDGTVLIDYNAYAVGDRIQIDGDTSGDYYRVLTDSSRRDDYVVALKENPLTVADLNNYGSTVGGSTYTHSDGVTGGMKYHNTSASYNSSNVKVVVDNWATAKFTHGELKTVDGYEARLVRFDEIFPLGYEINQSQSVPYYTPSSSTPSWVYSSQYWYWTMTQREDSSESYVWRIRNSGNIGNTDITMNNPAVRPVINLYKSKIAR